MVTLEQVNYLNRPNLKLASVTFYCPKWRKIIHFMTSTVELLLSGPPLSRHLINYLVCCLLAITKFWLDESSRKEPTKYCLLLGGLFIALYVTSFLHNSFSSVNFQVRMKLACQQSKPRISNVYRHPHGTAAAINMNHEFLLLIRSYHWLLSYKTVL